MIEVGRVCVKIAGRDAGCKCVIVDILNSPYVLIEGETRRRKCNVKHLEFLPQIVDVKKNATHEEVMKALSLEPKIKKSKAKKEKPRAVRKKKESSVQEETAAKKTAKKKK